MRGRRRPRPRYFSSRCGQKLFAVALGCCGARAQNLRPPGPRWSWAAHRGRELSPANLRGFGVPTRSAGKRVAGAEVAGGAIFSGVYLRAHWYACAHVYAGVPSRFVNHSRYLRLRGAAFLLRARPGGSLGRDRVTSLNWKARPGGTRRKIFKVMILTSCNDVLCPQCRGA